MRLGLVAVVLLVACGPMPEDVTTHATAPVRIAQLTLGDGVAASEPLELRLRIWADGVSAGDFLYQGSPDPFDEVGRITASAKHWKVSADYRDASGQHSVEREADQEGAGSLESLLLCLDDVEGQAESKVVLIHEPVDAPAPPPGPQVLGIGFDTPHTDYDWTDGPYRAELHDRIRWGADDWAEARATGQLEPGLYHLELITPRPALLAAGVVQVSQFVQTDDFAIEN